MHTCKAGSITTPKCDNVRGLYLEANATMAEVDKIHEKIANKIQEVLKRGEECIIMGDMKSAVNPDEKVETCAAKKILA